MKIKISSRLMILVYANVLLDLYSKSVDAQLSSCKNNPCKNGGICIDQQKTFYGYTCQCTADFIGVNCDQAKTNRDMRSDKDVKRDDMPGTYLSGINGVGNQGGPGTNYNYNYGNNPINPINQYPNTINSPNNIFNGYPNNMQPQPNGNYRPDGFNNQNPLNEYNANNNWQSSGNNNNNNNINKPFDPNNPNNNNRFDPNSNRPFDPNNPNNNNRPFDPNNPNSNNNNWDPNRPFDPNNINRNDPNRPFDPNNRDPNFVHPHLPGQPNMNMPNMPFQPYQPNNNIYQNPPLPGGGGGAGGGGVMNGAGWPPGAGNFYGNQPGEFTSNNNRNQCNCLNGGVCRLGYGSIYACTCYNGYYGNRCQYTPNQTQKGVIVAIVLGTVLPFLAIVVTVAIIVFFCCCRKQRGNQPQHLNPRTPKK